CALPILLNEHNPLCTEVQYRLPWHPKSLLHVDVNAPSHQGSDTKTLTRICIHAQLCKGLAFADERLGKVDRDVLHLPTADAELCFAPRPHIVRRGTRHIEFDA